MVEQKLRVTFDSKSISLSIATRPSIKMTDKETKVLEIINNKHEQHGLRNHDRMVALTYRSEKIDSLICGNLKITLPVLHRAPMKHQAHLFGKHQSASEVYPPANDSAIAKKLIPTGNEDFPLLWLNHLLQSNYRPPTLSWWTGQRELLVRGN